MKFTESTVEDAALAWLGELGFSVLHGPEIAPGELAAERIGFAETVLPKRLRAALQKLNPALPQDALDEAFRKVTVPQYFFSSRRRHTICSRDWSSDVCSSD